MTVGAAARRGRPRNEAVDVAIRDATIAEIIDRGFVGLSMESIAARAGVAKTTLYRRWSSSEELGLHAMAALEEPATDPPEGSPREQLLFLLDRMRHKWNRPEWAAMMRRVAADGTTHADVYRRGRERLIRPHMEAMDRALARCVDEGLIRPDADLDWARRMLVSPILASALLLRGRITQAQVETTLDTVLRGLAP